MIQLKVYEGNRQNNQTFLDLYETSPIKLNLSVEDITNAEAKSVFSRTFRVPGTNTNNQYFRMAFLVNGVDFDVTVKKPAEILVDGAEFRHGHIRMQKIYMNADQDKIDYEIIFLGETRDFSSAIGDARICELSMNDLAHTQSASNIETSWLAYPQSVSLTAGLADGNVIYPLVDFGNTYETGTGSHPEDQTRIAVNGSFNFTQNSHQLGIDRMKPMIRANRLIDQIFDDAGYTYTSTFLDSALFKQIYVSAFGNVSQVEFNVNENSNNTGHIRGTNVQAGADFDQLEYNETVVDLGGNFTIYATTRHGKYTIPSPGGSFSFSASAVVSAARELSQGGFQDIPVRLEIYSSNNTNIPIATGPYASFTSTATVNLNGYSASSGEEIFVVANPQTSPDVSQSEDANFLCTSAPGQVNPVSLLDCEYKQIDFIKDVLTTFRLVMAPDPTKTNNFIIEPFVDYITQGDLHDWSHKLDGSKDFIQEPLFFTQSDIIEYKHEGDGDFVNLYHEQAYKRVFGYYEDVSNNELLKGKREIKTEWAPTPITQIEGAASTSSFIIPRLHVNEQEDGENRKLAIKPKTRFLFYNGLQGTASNDWYLDGSTNNPHTTYPLVSYYEDWPPQNDSLVLNWNTDVAYWGTGVSGYQAVSDQDLYRVYWSAYIRSLYSSQARRVTAYFILNNVDLQNFSFDDIIFVNGTYYRPEAIHDAQIGERTSVKVDLIKLLDYKPVTSGSGSAFTATLTPSAPDCFNGNDGELLVDFTSTTAFPVTFTTTAGINGSLTTDPQTITGFTPGTYDITLTDSANRTLTDTFTIAQSSNAAISATASVTAPTDCNTNDGQIALTISGGTAPYTVGWTDGGSGQTRTGLGNGNFTYNITDANGCTFGPATVTVSCQVVVPSNNIDFIREYENCGVCQGESQPDCFQFVMVKLSNMTPSSLNGYYVFDGTSQGFVSDYPDNSNTFVVMDQDNSCGSGNIDWFYGTTFSSAVAAWENCSQTCGSLQSGFFTITNSNRNWVVE